MDAPHLTIRFAGDQRRFAPDEQLVGGYELELPPGQQPQAVEFSVLWYTEGKGDEDLHVHHFDREQWDDAGDAPGPLLTRDFRTKLPVSPLSYEGVIVKVRWCVRVRVFWRRGKELVAEEPFQLGDLPSARAVLPPPPPAEPAPNPRKRLLGGDDEE
jgi:hypothetical protein